MVWTESINKCITNIETLNVLYLMQQFKYIYMKKILSLSKDDVFSSLLPIYLSIN